MSIPTQHVSLTITENAFGFPAIGFGKPLILSYGASWAERTREYASYLDVLDDFTAGTPEALAAAAMFGQTPCPETIMIGRGALKPTMKYELSATAADSTTYEIDVSGPGITATTVSVTSDADATQDEIHDALVTALNAVTGKNYTATYTGTPGDPVVVTGAAAGNWFSLAPANATLVSSKMTHADPGIATDLAAIIAENDTWYALHTLFNSQDCVEGAASTISTLDKIYLFDVPETAAITTTGGAGGSADTLDSVATSAYDNVAGAYHPDPSQMFTAAWMGLVLPEDPGSETWKWKSPQGVTPVTLTSSQRAHLTERNANTVELIAGRNITWEGTTADGDYIDVRRGLHWLKDDMTTAVFGALAEAKKIPFTDAGIAVIEGVIRASLKRAVDRGIITADFTISVPKAANVSAANKTIRTLPDIRWQATLQGAVHRVVINGTVSV